MNELAHGKAIGGKKAVVDALDLWAGCAIGGANYSMLDARRRAELVAAEAGFKSVVADLSEDKDMNLVIEWAHKLLSVCYEIEGTNASNADVVVPDVVRLNWDDALHDGHHIDLSKIDIPSTVIFRWAGTWTRGRYIEVVLAREGESYTVSLEWDTGTGEPSTYLNLPILTDEADASTETRRAGGWKRREALLSERSES